MSEHWKDDQPIYRQLRDKVVGLILQQVFKEGEPVPSVRQISAEYSINHLTVSKAYQELVDDGLLEVRRGVGMFVVHGAREQLLAKERDKFMQYELPELLKRLKQLGISAGDMMAKIKALQEIK